MKSALAYRVMLSVLLAEHQSQWWTGGSPISRQHPRWEEWPAVSLSAAADICTHTDSQSGAMTWCSITHAWECVLCHCVSQGYILAGFSFLPFKNLPISVALAIWPQEQDSVHSVFGKVCKSQRSLTLWYVT